jgi:hypothetical protein
MKTLFTLLAALTMASMAGAQGNSTPVKPAGELLVLKETFFNFGKIQQGRPVTHEFTLTNSVSDTLKIEDVRASCGCTTPVWKHEPVAPNAASGITVGYNAFSEGPFEKTVTIFYNGSKTRMITIKGEVYKAPASAPENKGIQVLKQSNQ